MQPVPEYIGPQQYLAVAPFELAQVKPGAGQPELRGVEDRDLVDRNEQGPAAHGRDQAGHDREVGAAQADDDVGQPADRPAVLVGDRLAQQLGQAQRAEPRPGLPERLVWYSSELPFRRAPTRRLRRPTRPQAISLPRPGGRRREWPNFGPHRRSRAAREAAAMV